MESKCDTVQCVVTLATEDATSWRRKGGDDTSWVDVDFIVSKVSRFSCYKYTGGI
jgi:hypothetical protein